MFDTPAGQGAVFDRVGLPLVTDLLQVSEAADLDLMFSAVELLGCPWYLVVSLFRYYVDFGQVLLLFTGVFRVRTVCCSPTA